MIHEGRALRNAGSDNGPAHDYPVAVVYLYPFVVGDLGPGGVIAVDPYRLAAPRQRQHPEVVAEGGVDGPLAMGREEVQDEALFLISFGEFIQMRRIELPLEGGEPLVKLPVPGMVEVEGLPPAQGPPGDPVLHIERIGGIG